MSPALTLARSTWDFTVATFRAHRLASRLKSGSAFARDLASALYLATAEDLACTDAYIAMRDAWMLAALPIPDGPFTIANPQVTFGDH